MRRRKYNNRPTVIDGYRFDSKLEASRYGELRLLEKAGDIKDLEVHPHYPLEVNGLKICTYEADFRYTDNRGTIHVEDVKGFDTAVSRIKRKLVKATCEINVEIIR